MSKKTIKKTDFIKTNPIKNINQSIHFVLNKPSHPGNIGASARAIKNMGFSHLVLVSPDDFPSPKALARSTHAKDVLNKAKVYSHLDQALADKTVVFATTARNRDLNWPHLDAKKAAKKIIQFALKGNQVAIVFGKEESGLSNEDLAKANYLIHILANPQSCSLNLAAAVQIIAYEIFHHLVNQKLLLQRFRMDEPKAKQIEVIHLLNHLNQLMQHTNFLKNKPTKELTIRLARIFKKAKLDTQEITLLRGILASVVRYQNPKDKKLD